MIPLKNKTETEVAGALQKLFKERKPEKLWVDKGKEFYNKHCHIYMLVDLAEASSRTELSTG